MQILLPIVVLPLGEIPEVTPAIKAGVVAVVKSDLHRVVAHRLDTFDANR